MLVICQVNSWNHRDPLKRLYTTLVLSWLNNVLFELSLIVLLPILISFVFSTDCLLVLDLEKLGQIWVVLESERLAISNSVDCISSVWILIGEAYYFIPVSGLILVLVVWTCEGALLLWLWIPFLSYWKAIVLLIPCIFFCTLHSWVSHIWWQIVQLIFTAITWEDITTEGLPWFAFTKDCWHLCWVLVSWLRFLACINRSSIIPDISKLIDWNSQLQSKFLVLCLQTAVFRHRNQVIVLQKIVFNWARCLHK